MLVFNFWNIFGAVSLFFLLQKWLESIFLIHLTKHFSIYLLRSKISGSHHIIKAYSTFIDMLNSFSKWFYQITYSLVYEVSSYFIPLSKPDIVSSFYFSQRGVVIWICIYIWFEFAFILTNIFEHLVACLSSI